MFECLCVYVCECVQAYVCLSLYIYIYIYIYIYVYIYIYMRACVRVCVRACVCVSVVNGDDILVRPSPSPRGCRRRIFQSSRVPKYSYVDVIESVRGAAPVTTTN